MGDVCEGNDRGAWRHHLAELRLPHEDHSVVRGCQRRVAEDDLGEIERLSGAPDVRDSRG